MRHRDAAILAALLVVALPRPAAAQHSRRTRDCALADKRWDNPISDHGGMVLRRYQWHLFYATVSATTGYILHRTTKLPPWASAAMPTVAYGVVPHARGVIRGSYPVRAGDFAFDAFNRASPAFVIMARERPGWRSKAIAATAYVGGYLALACYGSP